MSDSGINFLYAGYTAVWLGWFLYLLYLHGKQSKLEKDFINLERMVVSHGRKGKRKK